MNEQEFAELSAGHALHALSAADEQRYRQALHAHPEWAAIADDDVEAATVLSDGLDPVAPPPALREHLLAQIATAPQHVAGSDGAAADMPAAESGAAAESPTGSRRRSRMRFALAACLVLLVGVGVAAGAIVQQLQRPASVVALDDIRSAADAQQSSVPLGSGGTATAHWSEHLGAAVLVTTGLADPGSSKTYELWFVRGAEPVPAGVFDTDDGNATALLQGDLRPGDVIAVTVEQEGGSPSGAPTTDPVIVIPTA